MQPPRIEPGTAEQAIYTWASQTVTGARGEGFALVSRGLRQSTAWLKALDTSRFQVAHPDSGASDSEWADSGFVGYGRIARDGLALVYKKMASAGTDAAGRPRFVVHAVVGNADDLDYLWAFDQGMSVFKSEAELPLDGAVELNPVELEPLGEWASRRPAGEWTEMAQIEARDAARLRLFTQGASWTGDVPFDRLAVAHLLHPTTLWRAINVESRWSPAGGEYTAWPVYTGPAPVREPRVSASVWNAARNLPVLELPTPAPTLGAQPAARTSVVWPPDQEAIVEFERRVEQQGLEADPVVRRNEQHLDEIATTTGASVHSAEAASPVEIARRIVAEHLREESTLNEVGLATVLRGFTAEKLDPDDLLVAAPDLLPPTFGGVQTRKEAAQVAAYLVESRLENLVDAFRHTGLPALLYAIALHPKRNPRSLTRPIPPEALITTLDWLNQTPPNGHQLTASLLQRGIAASATNRRTALNHMLGNPRVLFDNVLPELNPADTSTGEVLKDCFDQWAAYRHISATEGAVLRNALFRRRRGFPFGGSRT